MKKEKSNRAKAAKLAEIEARYKKFTELEKKIRQMAEMVTK